MRDFVIYVCPKCGETQKQVHHPLRIGSTLPLCPAHAETAPVMVQCWPVPKTAEIEIERVDRKIEKHFDGWVRDATYMIGVSDTRLRNIIKDYLERGEA